MTAARVRSMPAPELSPANDNADAEAQAATAMRRFLAAFVVFTLAAMVGWGAVGLLIAMWVFR